MQSSIAWAKAADYAARAEEACDDHARFLFTTLRESWMRVARNWEAMETEQESERRPAAVGVARLISR